MPHLHFTEGDRPLFVHLLRPSRTVIGRSDRCDVSLPSESVSRVHCTIERKADGWWLVDRSRHGTRVNGEAVERRILAPGDEIGIGVYTAKLTFEGDAHYETPTSTSPLPAAIHEELVDVGPDGVTSSRSRLRFVRGPLEGRSFLLKQARTTLGGPGADIVMDDALPRKAVRVRVVRGRAMIEPCEAACLLAGVRVREITPAIEGEELRIGEHGFTFETDTSEDAEERDAFGEMVGRSPAMRRLFGVLVRMARHDEVALVTGESGTGKELAARGLHDAGPRHDGPFVAVNCAAISEALFESELFGHEKGAFTGAVARQDGAFQRAHGGTLFLDEVGELKMAVQAKLLRALESGEVRRVGGATPEFPDVRLIAATNRDLHAMVHAGTFREDLYFRLAILTVRIPPLRERKEDIAPLAAALLSRTHRGAALAPDALESLIHHSWPGNVRELRNVLTRAFVLTGSPIAAAHLSFDPLAFEGAATYAARRDEASERNAILGALKRHGGNRTRAAQDLGMPRSSLLYRIKRLGIGRE